MILPVLNRNNSLQSALEEVAALCKWLDDEALPIWLQTGFDPELGLFHERLDLDGNACKDLPRRLLVQCRQITVYAHATLRGRVDAKAQLIEVFERVRSLYAIPDHPGHWRFSVTQSGSPHDDRLDSYTLSFLIFALAWLYRLEPAESYLQEADKVFAVIESALTATGGGVVTGLPVKGDVLLQNPNMHLFEACLAMYEAARRPQDMARAERLLDLFEKKIFDRRHRALPEKHKMDWTVWSPSENWFEPGHHFEWVWLLRQFERLGGRSSGSLVAELLESAIPTGLDQNSVAIEQIGLERNFRLNSSRNWGTCEYIKCCSYEYQQSVWRNDLVSADMWARRARDGMRALRDVFLSHSRRGLWHDRVDADYSSLTDYVPASSFYHIGFAIAEAERIFTRYVPKDLGFTTAKRRALFLDRDGVVNVDASYAYRPDQIMFLPGVDILIEAANRLGYLVIVVTNQSGVARGYYAESEVIALHQWMNARLQESGASISAFYHCPYLGDGVSLLYARESHFDRKPRAGMLKRAALEWNIDLGKSLMIGDRHTDQSAALEVGMNAVLISGDHSEALKHLQNFAHAGSIGN